MVKKTLNGSKEELDSVCVKLVLQFQLLNTCLLQHYRDVDETISWIKEKEQLMASDDFGRDLASVQTLLRKHEGLERDLAALEDKVILEI